MTAWTPSATVPFDLDRYRGTNVFELPRTPGLVALHTEARNAETGQERFVRASGRIVRILLEAALSQVEHRARGVTTPTGYVYEGAEAVAPLYAVSIPRAGDALESGLREIRPDARIGKILIQRDVATKQPALFYSKLPPGIGGNEVLLLDPTIATGGTLLTAVNELVAAGVEEHRIIVVNVLTCPEGLSTVLSRRPDLRIVTSHIDNGLTDQAFMRPGIGDFGDRFYGTTRELS
ncbi:uracil phosphoribosyltransferase [Williamsia sterculiae]|uniref:uracil phosphoribosyltransferase n=1 Tax=Williamsia sterculiae TaxID=1344003 RepID=A0A1N7EKC6_9NOCA|nr:uracil phosphoribosyltransferase [Williamsia sterculiae]SIR88448.1 uracil phosphoribosyltransferase [Williamsia sterculiae]